MATQNIQDDVGSLALSARNVESYLSMAARIEQSARPGLGGSVGGDSTKRSQSQSMGGTLSTPPSHARRKSIKGAQSRMENMSTAQLKKLHVECQQIITVATTIRGKLQEAFPDFNTPISDRPSDPEHDGRQKEKPPWTGRGGGGGGSRFGLFRRRSTDLNA